ncbi:MAG: hypothetical protein ACYCRE_10545, partial [Acidobacteriaceae bacterium]
MTMQDCHSWVSSVLARYHLLPNLQGTYPRRISCLDVETLAIKKDQFGTVKLLKCFDSGARG